MFGNVIKACKKAFAPARKVAGAYDRLSSSSSPSQPSPFRQSLSASPRSYHVSALRRLRESFHTFTHSLHTSTAPLIDRHYDIPEGCAYVSYDASYDKGAGIWYLSTCAWRRDGTLLRVHVVGVRGSKTAFPRADCSIEGEIVGQNGAVKYFVNKVKGELSPTEYENGVIFQGDNDQAVNEFRRCLEGHDAVFDKRETCDDVLKESRAILQGAGIENVQSIHASDRVSKVAKVTDKVGKYIRSDMAFSLGLGFRGEGERDYTSEEIVELSKVHGIEQHLYYFRDEDDEYKKLMAARAEESKKRRITRLKNWRSRFSKK